VRKRVRETVCVRRLRMREAGDIRGGTCNRPKSRDTLTHIDTYNS